MFGFKDRVPDAQGLVSSIGSVGDADDRPCTKMLFGLCKSEYGRRSMAAARPRLIRETHPAGTVPRSNRVVPPVRTLADDSHRPRGADAVDHPGGEAFCHRQLCREIAQWDHVGCVKQFLLEVLVYRAPRSRVRFRHGLGHLLDKTVVGRAGDVASAGVRRGPVNRDSPPYKVDEMFTRLMTVISQESGFVASSVTKAALSTVLSSTSAPASPRTWAM
jgi:hypothetical protein